MHHHECRHCGKYFDRCTCRTWSGTALQTEAAKPPANDPRDLPGYVEVFKASPAPTVIRNELVVMYDVDDTLVLWNPDSYKPGINIIEIIDPNDNQPVFVEPHERHIKLLKSHKGRGKTVFVWSAGGYAWAEAVVKALGLEQYVDFIMTKPKTYVDDLPVQEFMTERIYISPKKGE